MLPFCGYHMGDYFRHWINMHKTIRNPPRIFHVNWFRKDGQGGFIWPGFGENMRVLKWIVDRCRSRTDAEETPLGWVPGPRALDLDGLTNFSAEKLEQLQAIREDEWRREILMQDELFMKLHSRLPKELIFQRELLLARL
jgi:phosphoenolpyruvate carboxykinase (GTP)